MAAVRQHSPDEVLLLQAMCMLRKQQHELEAELEHQRERLHSERQHMQAAQEEQHRGLTRQQVPAHNAIWSLQAAATSGALCSREHVQPVLPVSLWAG